MNSVPLGSVFASVIDRFTAKVERFMDERKLRCEAAAITQYGATCSERATVWDEETERHLCEKCAQKKERGQL